LRVTPRAGENSIAGVGSDGAIRIHIAAPPVQDKANEALIRFLAEVLGIAKSRIEIIAGASSRNKLVTILDMDAPTAQRKILSRLP
jgi:hypothetical protein